MQDIKSNVRRTNEMPIIHAVFWTRLTVKIDLPEDIHCGGCFSALQYSVVIPRTIKNSMMLIQVLLIKICFHSYLASTCPSSLFSEVEIFPAKKFQRHWSYTVGTFNRENDPMSNISARDTPDRQRIYGEKSATKDNKILSTKHLVERNTSPL